MIQDGRQAQMADSYAREVKHFEDVEKLREMRSALAGYMKKVCSGRLLERRVLAVRCALRMLPFD